MSVLVFTDGKVWQGGYDLSGDHNKMTMNIEVEEKDFTRFGASGKERRAGLTDINLQGEGFVNAGVDLQDDVHFSDHGVYPRVTSVAAVGAEDDVAYTMRGVSLKYMPLDGNVGDEHKFQIEASGSGLWIPGKVLHNATRTTSGNGTALQPASPASGENAYAALHVLAASGGSPTLDVDVESDSTGGFGTPTIQHSFSQFTGVGAEFSAAMPGPISDTFWRVAWTIGGTTPSFTFVVVFGIR